MKKLCEENIFVQLNMLIEDKGRCWVNPKLFLIRTFSRPPHQPSSTSSTLQQQNTIKSFRQDAFPSSPCKNFISRFDNE